MGARARPLVLAAAFAVLVAGIGAVAAMTRPTRSGRRSPPSVQSASSPASLDPDPTTTAAPPATTTTVDQAAVSAFLNAQAAGHQSVQRPVAAAPRPAPLPTPRPEPNRSAPARSTPPPPAPGAVWTGDFPDPFVLAAGGEYYAFGTESGLTDVQTIKSVDLVHWQWVGDALPRLPGWANWGYTWAPSVLARTPDYVLYYTTQEASSGRQCISRGLSVLPQGPYVDTSSGPLICQLDRGGSMDPSPFVDSDGTAWLTWKSQGTLSGEPNRIWIQQLTPDGQQLVGQPTELLHTDEGWQAGTVEGPTMVKVGTTYYLFYSGNLWNTAAYAVGYAVCDSRTGPCHEAQPGPLLASSGSMAGPGGQTPFVDAAGVWHLAFHAWTSPNVGYPAGARSLRIAPLSFAGGAVSVGST